MKIWIPYTVTGGGADVSTQYLGSALTQLGHDVILQPLPYRWQYFPWRLKLIKPPAGTQIVVANSLNGIAFKRASTRLVVIERLFVLDPALRPYRSTSQAIVQELLTRHFVSRSYRFADAVVALSEYSADQMKAVFPALQPSVILTGVDTKFFCPAAEGKPPLRNRPVRLLFAGNLIRRKGADMLVPILQKLGDGYELWYTSGLRTADVLKGTPRTRPLGKLTQEQMREAYRNVDILVAPTRLEGLSRVILEALACGTPVVASNSASLPEAVDEKVTGRLCPVDDVAAFAAAIRDMSSNPDCLIEMGRQARVTAEKRFRIDRMVEEYAMLFEGLVAEKRQA